MAEIKQVHLVGEGLSYRGVRFRVPGPDDVDEATLAAARTAASADDAYKVGYVLPRFLLERCIVSVTATGVGKAEAEAARDAARKAEAKAATEEYAEAQKRGATKDELAKFADGIPLRVEKAAVEAALNAAGTVLVGKPDADWVRVTAEDMVNKSSGRSLSNLFNVKDYQALRTIFHRFYDTRALDAEMILGKALTVSMG